MNGLIQNYTENSEYEILTPFGWQDFKGVIHNIGERKGRRITTDQGAVEATLDHRFVSNGELIAVEDIVPGMCLDGQNGPQRVESTEEINLAETFEIFDSTDHIIYANGISSHQCDEFAFVAPNAAGPFWTAIQPTLSTGGGCIITSTPKSDTDQFAQIWRAAMDNKDEFGNLTSAHGRGKNDFFAIKVPWSEHPERDEEWAKPFRESLGEAKFAQEMECCHADTAIWLKSGDREFPATMGDLFHTLKMAA